MAATVTARLARAADATTGKRILLVLDEGQHREFTARHVRIGSADDNDLVLEDATVSRHHCVLERAGRGLLVRDLDSTNGTFVHDVRVREAWVWPGWTLRLGRRTLRIEAPGQRMGFGGLVGQSRAMQRLFAILEQIAPTDVTVLIEGETGTGKGQVARAIHEASLRAGGPFVVVDCAALPPTLIETELFGCERGAFTGADVARPGAFEAAHRGTLFLDEIGELPFDLQPKFLRALEEREVRPVGATQARSIDVRLIAATNVDLCGAVKAGRFRSDLYYRLDVVRVHVPPLRERPDDVPLLVRHFQGAHPEVPPLDVTADQLELLARRRWPGNVRELRAAVERALVLGDRTMLFADGGDAAVTVHPEAPRPFREEKQRAIEEFERRYVRDLLERTGGNTSEAARLGKMDRNYLRLLIERRLVDRRG